jgi:hypothetical protein
VDTVSIKIFYLIHLNPPVRGRSSHRHNPNSTRRKETEKKEAKGNKSSQESRTCAFPRDLAARQGVAHYTNASPFSFIFTQTVFDILQLSSLASARHDARYGTYFNDVLQAMSFN